jgi:hypothetical protein
MNYSCHSPLIRYREQKGSFDLIGDASKVHLKDDILKQNTRTIGVMISVHAAMFPLIFPPGL